MLPLHFSFIVTMLPLEQRLSCSFLLLTSGSLRPSPLLPYTSSQGSVQPESKSIFSFSGDSLCLSQLLTRANWHSQEDSPCPGDSSPTELSTQLVRISDDKHRTGCYLHRTTSISAATLSGGLISLQMDVAGYQEKHSGHMETTEDGESENSKSKESWWSGP